MRILSIFICSVLMLTLTCIRANPLDSIRTETVKGKKFIIHKIDKGQGLYAIARRYSTDVQQIINANPGKVERLEQGAMIRIPLLNDTMIQAETGTNEIKPAGGKTEKNATDSVKKYDNNKIDEGHANADAKESEPPKTHIVIAGETVSKIAQRYRVTPQLIVKWNGIRDNRIEVGQELIVNGSLVIKPFEKWNAPNSVAPKNNPPVNILAGADLIEETGFAGMEPGKVILHKTAPAGTLILVTNLDNGKQCYVKVSGKLEQEYKNLVLLIDENAREKLDSSSGLLRIKLKYASSQ